jgi:MerC mercury resistance protein
LLFFFSIISFLTLVPTALFRRAADYGGILNAALCVLHCAAGPVLLVFWGAQAEGEDGNWDLLFLGLSAVLAAVATWQLSSPGLRVALWGFFGLFAGATLGADAHPAWQWLQYAASLGLMGTHLLNLRYCRRCATPPATAQPRPTPA